MRYINLCIYPFQFRSCVFSCLYYECIELFKSGLDLMIFISCITLVLYRVDRRMSFVYK